MACNRPNNNLAVRRQRWPLRHRVAPHTHTPYLSFLHQTLIPPLVLSCSGRGQAVRADLQTRRLSLLRPPGRDGPRWNLLCQRLLEWRVRGGEVPGECVLKPRRCAIFRSECLERRSSLSGPGLMRWRVWICWDWHLDVDLKIHHYTDFIFYLFSLIHRSNRSDWLPKTSVELQTLVSACLNSYFSVPSTFLEEVTRAGGATLGIYVVSFIIIIIVNKVCIGGAMCFPLWHHQTTENCVVIQFLTRLKSKV